MITETWKEKENRRKFFETYAEQNGFNHLDIEKWYLQPRNKIISQQVFKINIINI